MADIKFDENVLKKIREALGDHHPRYLNKVYGDITLEDQLLEINEIKELKAKVDRLENNHIAHMGQDIYKLGKEVAELRKLIKGDL